MKQVRAWGVAVALTVLTGCLHVNGPAPLKRTALVLRLTNETAEQVAAQIKQVGADYVILAGARDTTFFKDVATRALMKSTRSGQAADMRYGFLAVNAPVGDTMISVKVQGGGELRMHDALYKIDKGRQLDIMEARFDASSDIRQVVRALIQYNTTDVSATAEQIIVLHPPTAAAGDSVSVLLRPYLTDAWECTKEGKAQSRNATLPLRVFYGPATRESCDDATLVSNAGGGMVAHLVLLR